MATSKKSVLTNAELVASLRAQKDCGATRDQAIGYLMAEQNFKYDDARKLCIEVYGANGRGSADHATAVSILIVGKENGRTNKEIIAELCGTLSWKESTAATLLAYHPYMVEYAKQVRA